MLIDCPTCSRCYHVDSSELGTSGRMVICPRCQTRWFAGDASLEPARGDIPRLIGTVGDPGAAPIVESRHARRRPIGIGTAMATVGIVCMAVLLVEARERVVQFVPGAAAAYTAAGLGVHPRGLDFAKTATVRRDPASSDVIISGEIRNRAKRRLAIPRLVYEIRDETGASLVKWTESARTTEIQPGRILAFASSPHHLPSASRTALVKFEADAPGSSVAGQ